MIISPQKDDVFSEEEIKDGEKFNLDVTNQLKSDIYEEITDVVQNETDSRLEIPEDSASVGIGTNNENDASALEEEAANEYDIKDYKVFIRSQETKKESLVQDKVEQACLDDDTPFVSVSKISGIFYPGGLANIPSLVKAAKDNTEDEVDASSSKTDDKTLENLFDSHSPSSDDQLAVKITQSSDGLNDDHLLTPHDLITEPGDLFLLMVYLLLLLRSD